MPSPIAGPASTAEKGISPSPALGAGSRFIPEIQGLRTLALMLVVVYHVWFQRVSGGVDVFLLVSAYLMTRAVLHSAGQGREFNPVKFLVRRFGRLLPLAGATVALTLVLSLAVFPVWRWEALLEDGRASLLYYENRLLQNRATDYYSADLTTRSPNQHYWSLSIQGQVFALWAAAHALALLVAELTKSRPKVWLFIGFALVFVASLAFSIWMTDASQERAYFDIRARLWEFALGSLLALVGEVRIRPTASRALTLVGVTMIVICGFLLPVGTTFPGFAALWPLGGAALVLLASSGPNSAPSFLAHPWLVRAGAYSYALYLTHWPILVAAQAISTESDLGLLKGAGVLLASAAVSVALVHLVEKPLAAFQSSGSVWRSLIVVIGILAIGCSTLFGLGTFVETRTADDQGSQARQSWVRLGEECDDEAFLEQYCSATATGGTDAPKVTFLGNSHMQQYVGAFLPTIADEGWRAEAYLLPGCHFRSEPGEGRERTCFEAWEEARNGQLLADTDVLILLGSTSSPRGDVTPEGMDEFIVEVREAGTEVIAIRDNPRFTENIFACGEQHGHLNPTYSIELEGSWRDSLRLEPASLTLDLTDTICPGYTCLPKQGDDYVFLDDNHITGTFAARLNLEVDSALREVMEKARS